MFCFEYMYNYVDLNYMHEVMSVWVLSNVLYVEMLLGFRIKIRLYVYEVICLGGLSDVNYYI